MVLYLAIYTIKKGLKANNLVISVIKAFRSFLESFLLYLSVYFL